MVQTGFHFKSYACWRSYIINPGCINIKVFIVAVYVLTENIMMAGDKAKIVTVQSINTAYYSFKMNGCAMFNCIVMYRRIYCYGCRHRRGNLFFNSNNFFLLAGKSERTKDNKQYCSF